MNLWIALFVFEAVQLGLIIWVGLSKRNDGLATDEILSKVKLLLLRQRIEEEAKHDR